MRYRCENKECKYKYKGKTAELPDKCPKCGGCMVRYKLARAIGKGYEYEIRDIINRTFDLKDRTKVRRMPLSGAVSGLKGDLINLPTSLDKFVPELKKHSSIKFPMWFNQTKQEAIHMGKLPWLIFKNPSTGEDVSCMVLQDFLNLVRKLSDEK